MFLTEKNVYKYAIRLISMIISINSNLTLTITNNKIYCV